jgi:hypothetical protein
VQDEQIYAGCTRPRLELADWLGTLTSPPMDTRSFCAEWTVREVASPLTAGIQRPLDTFWSLGVGAASGANPWTTAGRGECWRTTGAPLGSPLREPACADTEEVTGSNPVSPTNETSFD